MADFNSVVPSETEYLLHWFCLRLPPPSLCFSFFSSFPFLLNLFPFFSTDGAAVFPAVERRVARQRRPNQRSDPAELLMPAIKHLPTVL